MSVEIVICPRCGTKMVTFWEGFFCDLICPDCRCKCVSDQYQEWWKMVFKVIVFIVVLLILIATIVRITHAQPPGYSSCIAFDSVRFTPDTLYRIQLREVALPTYQTFINIILEVQHLGLESIPLRADSGGVTEYYRTIAYYDSLARLNADSLNIQP